MMHRIQMTFIIFCVAHLFGCSFLRTNDKERIRHNIVLRLLPLENVHRIWPPAVIVERYDGKGAKIAEALPETYSIGVAVLLVDNWSNKKHTLQTWTSNSWKLCIKQKDGSTLYFPLVPSRRNLPSLSPPLLSLGSQSTLGLVVGAPTNTSFTLVSHERVRDGWEDIVGTMCVKYEDDRLKMTSTELPIYLTFMEEEENNEGKSRSRKNQGQPSRINLTNDAEH